MNFYGACIEENKQLVVLIEEHSTSSSVLVSWWKYFQCSDLLLQEFIDGASLHATVLHNSSLE